jgi:four helix bundle protein
MDKIKSFRDLMVWQRAVDLAVHIYKATEQFPKSEMYGWTNQMRRAGVSVASNIAEGYNRSQAELSHFLQPTTNN